MQITIIGAGRMAKAIGVRLLSAGSTLTVVNRNILRAEKLRQEFQRITGKDITVKPFGEELDGEIAILAIPYATVEPVLNQYREQLQERILVDITNPVNFRTFELSTPLGSSAAQEIAKLVPGARIVKAFNTVFAATLLRGRVAGQILDIFLAGDDEAAKQKLGVLIERSGLRAIDVGPLHRAHHLEALQLLHMVVQDQLETEYESAVKIIFDNNSQ